MTLSNTQRTWTISGSLRYRMIAPRWTGAQYIAFATVKVPGGVRFLTCSWWMAPDETLLIARCLRDGQLSMRPYVVGQATDDSTIDCVMALYHDLCVSYGLDATDLLLRSDPAWARRERWAQYDWDRFRRIADFEGTLFPLTWTDDAILGLMMSLENQGLPALATSLGHALKARRGRASSLRGGIRHE
jgi:hypothetical protein